MNRPIQFVFAVLFLLGSMGISHAGDVDADILLSSMVDQGLMTQEEAQTIKDRSKAKAIEKALDQGMDQNNNQADKMVGQDDQMVVRLPKWVRNITLQGDLTVRYDQQKTKDINNSFKRNRGRLRYRLGIASQINPKVKVAAGLASSENVNDPRSSFQTFGSSSSKKNVTLDYAYAEWKAAPWFSTIMGKFPSENYLWHPTDMMWDSDIKPEGGAIHLETPSVGGLKGFVNSGIIVLDEETAYREDPTQFHTQLGVALDTPHVDAKIAAQRYAYNTLTDRILKNSSCTNNGIAPGDPCTGGLQMEYDAGGAGAEVGIKFDLFGRHKRIAAFGEYIKNLASTRDEIGWAAGGRMGDEQVNELGDWQALYQYTVLQRDAVLDIFPNSERYDGGTNVRGVKIGFDLGLWKDIKWGLNWYHDEAIKGSKSPRTSLLTDLTYKF